MAVRAGPPLAQEVRLGPRRLSPGERQPALSSSSSSSFSTPARVLPLARTPTPPSAGRRAAGCAPGLHLPPGTHPREGAHAGSLTLSHTLTHTHSQKDGGRGSAGGVGALAPRAGSSRGGGRGGERRGGRGEARGGESGARGEPGRGSAAPHLGRRRRHRAVSVLLLLLQIFAVAAAAAAAAAATVHVQGSHFLLFHGLFGSCRHSAGEYMFSLVTYRAQVCEKSP